MRSRPLPRRSADSGFALVLVLLLVLIGSLIVRGQSGTARTSVRIAHNNELGARALALAEAGAAHAVALVADGSGFGAGFDQLLRANGTGGALGDVGRLVSDAAGPLARHVNVGGAQGSDGYYLRAIDNHDETPSNGATDVDRVLRLRSTGRLATAERTVEVRIRRESGFGLFAKTSLELAGSGRIDSYDSARGDYASTVGEDARVGSNGSVDTGSVSTTIGGDVYSGGTVSGAGTVTGATVTGMAPITLDPVAPCGPAYSDGSGLSGSYAYNGAADGDLVASGLDDVRLDPGTYCFDNITLSGSATLTVTAGPVEIFLTGTADFGGGGLVNETHSPSALMIRSSGDEFSLAGTTAVHAVVYAPDAVLTISGTADFYGTAVADRIRTNGSVGVHVDLDAGFDGDVTVLSWTEVRRR